MDTHNLRLSKCCESCIHCNKPNYHWEYKELGEIGSEISNYDVKRFIE